MTVQESPVAGGTATSEPSVVDAKSSINVEDDGGVRLVTLNRPSKLNSLTEGMFDELTDILIDSSVRRSVKCVVITGTGRAFCTGWDLDEMAAPLDTQDGRRHGAPPCLHEFAHFRKPLMCAVNGLAIGFGASTPLFCDISLASTEARFRFPFAELGLAGEGGVPYTLPLRVGYQEASRLLMTCEWLSAEEAADIGLVWKAVAPDELMPMTLEMAHRIAAMPGDAMEMTKKLILAGKIDGIRAALARDAESYAVLLGGKSNQAAIADFRARQAAKKGQAG